ncbi:hypothetical protein Vadar_024259 [Vaccinium darrowii]|uniref:Uncharacterized protein n=1 Tax=Vaccinium darrowii TaxID=229202 RepID=A0ACB7Y2Z2_9ERIC|nr:hypothetical protein Vadar_024259 [Vaccinium darrowii]
MAKPQDLKLDTDEVPTSVAVNSSRLLLAVTAELRQWSAVQGYCFNFKELTDNQWFTGRRFVELLHKGTQRGNSSRCSTFSSFHHGQAMGLAKLQEMTIEFARRSKNSGMSLPFGNQNPTTSTNASLLTTTKKISLEMEKREGRPTVRSINFEGSCDPPAQVVHQIDPGGPSDRPSNQNTRQCKAFCQEHRYFSNLYEIEGNFLQVRNFTIFSNRAVALGSCPKFGVLIPKQLRFSVWNHVIDLIRSRRQVIVMCNSAMAAGVPFVGWYHVRYQAEGSPTEGFYYVYTEALVRTMAVVAYNRGPNHVASKVHRNFRSKYGSVLPLGNVVQ